MSFVWFSMVIYNNFSVQLVPNVFGLNWLQHNSSLKYFVSTQYT